MQSTALRDRVHAMTREPLVHFLLLGAAIYVVHGLATRDVRLENESQRITVTAGEIEWLTSTWEKRWNRPPAPLERSGLIEEYVRETVLYREALAMGLDRNDTIVRRRLAQKLEFLSQDLISTIRPSDEDLRGYFAEHTERYVLPALTTFTHVFVDPDRRGASALADAEEIGAALRGLASADESALELGDPFLLQPYYPERSEAEVAKLFGGGFAREVSGQEPGGWRGPVTSGYGLHWVYVEHRTPATTPEFAAVRDRVERDWEEELRARLNEDFYTALRARYDVVVEEPSVEASERSGSAPGEGEPRGYASAGGDG